MPPDPKKPIEKMLEESAKIRRAAFGGDAKMPNPMRARLHDEVRAGLADRAEVADRAGLGQTRSSWIHMFWPRLGVAAAMATVLVVGSTVWWRETHSSSPGMMQVAGNAPASSAERRKAEIPPEQMFAKGPAAADATAHGVSLGDNSVARIEPAQTPVADVDSLGLSRKVTAATSQGDAAKESLAPTESAEGANGAMAAAPAAAAPMAASKPHVGESVVTAASQEHRRAADATAGANAPRKFGQLSNSQSFRNNSQSNKVPNVLNTFTVEQQGQDIRVVDSDGSTYAGKLEDGAQRNSYLAKDDKRGEADNSQEKGETAQPPEARFRASGYNISLQKPVVFEGNYIDMPQQQSQRFQEDKKAPNKDKAEEQQNVSRIVGTARVNGQPPVQVDATAIVGGADTQK